MIEQQNRRAEKEKISFGNNNFSKPSLTLLCNENNDLFRTLRENNVPCLRYSSLAELLSKTPSNAPVMLLADDYPLKPLKLGMDFFTIAIEKKFRLYIEFADMIPGIDFEEICNIRYERGVINSVFWGAGIEQGRIVEVSDCYFYKIKNVIDDPHIVIAKVAGLDKAVFGLQNTESYPLFFRHTWNGYEALIATTKLSQFRTARYAPAAAWKSIWKGILSWLDRDVQNDLAWQSDVRPTYDYQETLPDNAVVESIKRCVNWHHNSKMLIHQSWSNKIDTYAMDNSRLFYDWGEMPDLDMPGGDGSLGILEGFASRIQWDGTQLVSWARRSDCNGETSLLFAMDWLLNQDEKSKAVASNLLDWLYFNSNFLYNDPSKSEFGLLAWTPRHRSTFYPDNDIKAILGCIGTAGILQTDRWDDVLIRNILGNFRLTSRNGFRPNAFVNNICFKWEAHALDSMLSLAPHYQAWIWSAYLWLYDKVRWAPLLERTRNGIEIMMEAYPDNWEWQNGFQQERARMILPLAWLIRLDNNPKYRDYLAKIINDLADYQAPCGAVAEILGNLKKGKYKPNQSNAEYGTRECSLIQNNGDKVADMLYTCNFVFFGLHEAYMATGEKEYLDMANKLEDFFIRIQIKSEVHPEFDGAWYRTFDYDKWEYWGSNSDLGWGPWCLEVGWTESWIPLTMALRKTKKSLWELSADSQIAGHFEKYKKIMLDAKDVYE